MSPIEIHMNAHNSYYRCPLEWYSSVNHIININESKIVAKLGFFKTKKSNQGRDAIQTFLRKNRDKSVIYKRIFFS